MPQVQRFVAIDLYRHLLTPLSLVATLPVDCFQRFPIEQGRRLQLLLLLQVRPPIIVDEFAAKQITLSPS